MEWPPNALRVSFATYHVAAFEQPGLTALLLGHRKGESGVLWDWYLGARSKAEGEAYFQIVPPTGL